LSTGTPDDQSKFAVNELHEFTLQLRVIVG